MPIGIWSNKKPEVTLLMDTSLIGTLENPYKTSDRYGPFVKAVLLASGVLRRVQRTSDIYALVLTGYEGLEFGDDGTYTALVASELPLSIPDGIRRLEEEIDAAVKETNPRYCAEHIGYIALDQAAVLLGLEIKRENGIELPSSASWSRGTIVIPKMDNSPNV